MTTETNNSVYNPDELNNDVAEAVLSEQFTETASKVKGIAYKADNSRELVLTRDANKASQKTRPYVYFWSELRPTEESGIQVKRVYESEETRSHFVTNNTDNLGHGNQAFYLVASSKQALEDYRDWYNLQ
jgi:hypothetical protein